MFFYSCEHEPIHVHVQKGEYESIFDLLMENGKLKEIIHRNKAGVDSLPEKDMKAVKKFIKKYAMNIVDKWVKYFILKKKVKITKITERV